MITAIIPAGGSGNRLAQKADKPSAPALEKQFLPLAGKPIIVHTIQALFANPQVRAIILALPAYRLDYMQEEIIKKYNLHGITLVEGGKSRQESVFHALQVVPDACEYLLVHDAVRPCVSSDILERVIETGVKKGAAITAIAVTDTLKKKEGSIILETIDRSKLVRVQTPQVFRRTLLEQAYRHAKEQGLEGTDDASLLEAINLPVYTVTGSAFNIKITYPEDLAVAESFLKLIQKA